MKPLTKNLVYRASFTLNNVLVDHEFSFLLSLVKQGEIMISISPAVV